MQPIHHQSLPYILGLVVRARICFIVGVAFFAPFGFGQDDVEILMNLDFEDDRVGEQPDFDFGPETEVDPNPNEGSRGFVVIDGASEPPNPLSGKSLYIRDEDSDGQVRLFLPFNGGTNRSNVRLSFDFQRAYAVEESDGQTGILVIFGRAEHRLSRFDHRLFDLAVLNNGALRINAPSRRRSPRVLTYDTESANRVDLLANSHDTDPVEYDLEDLGAGTLTPNSFHLFLNGEKMGEYAFTWTPDGRQVPFDQQDDDLGKLGFFQGTTAQGGIVFDNILLTRLAPPTSGKLNNISTRALVGTGDEVMIGGFTVHEAAQQVLIQALGPELANRGISNALADPVLTVINTADPTNPMMVNDNWEDSQGQLVADLWGGSPNLTLDSLSSAAVLTLDPGNYTAKVEGKDGTTGVALIEVYEIDDAPPSYASGKLNNISTRALVGTGDEVMIGGFTVHEAAQQVLIQALGPELANRGISNALADPVLTVINTADPTNPMMVNDNWEDSQGELISDLWGDGLPLTSGSLSSAAVLTLEPGGYTAKVEGKDGTTGVALIEVYEIDDAEASDDAVTVVTADSARDFQYRAEYVTFLGGRDNPFGLRGLSLGGQRIHLNFEVQLELPDNLPPAPRALVAWIGMGQKADLWATDGTAAFFSISLDPENAGVGVIEQSAGSSFKDVTFTPFAGQLSGEGVRVSLEITTPIDFRTRNAEDELLYTCAMEVDFDQDGQIDATIPKVSFIDSKWGFSLWLGLERWWFGAGNTARQTPLKLYLNPGLSHF